jgi:predicted nucleotidyltransferase
MLGLEPKGYVLKVNEQGFFDNHFAWDTISSQSQIILKQAVDMLLEEHKDNIDSIYVRGSFANNSSVDNYSDIDLIIIDIDPLLNLPSQFIYNDSTFRLDIELLSTEDILNRDKYFVTHFLLKTQSVCIYGNSRLDDILEFDASKETASHFGRNIPQLIMKAKAVLLQKPEQLAGITQWIARAILRAGNALFLDKAKVYTRDLVYCYRYLIQYSPEYEPQLRVLVEQAITPTLTQEELFNFLDDFGLKLAEEIEEYFANITVEL